MSGGALDLYELAPCGYAVLDGVGSVLEANHELLRLLGRPREEVTGRAFPSFLTIGARIYFDTHIYPLLAIEGLVREIALDVVHQDGTRVPVLMNANRVGAGDPGSARILVVLVEATDRRRYETDLLETTRTAETARREADELAETLQQTLIPPTPPTIEGLSIAAAYRPAGDGRVVGGDFYDVFQVDDDEWVVVVGDVTGKGIAAATVTAFVRHTIRDLAMRVRDPSDLLRELNRSVMDHDTDRFCTLIVLRLVAHGGDWVVRGSVGGHPLPVVRRADGTVEELGEHGSLVGVMEDPAYTTFERRLGEDLVMLYTDGVIEARHQGRFFGAERLLPLVAATRHDPVAVTTAVVTAVLEFQLGDADDDIAVLTLGRDGTGAPGD